jgi:hypothetical protein
MSWIASTTPVQGSRALIVESIISWVIPSSVSPAVGPQNGRIASRPIVAAKIQ